jgi:hypothetical protein
VVDLDSFACEADSEHPVPAAAAAAAAAAINTRQVNRFKRFSAILSVRIFRAQIFAPCRTRCQCAAGV